MCVNIWYMYIYICTYLTHHINDIYRERETERERKQKERERKREEHGLLSCAVLWYAATTHAQGQPYKRNSARRMGQPTTCRCPGRVH